jgi:hypothetical protein
VYKSILKSLSQEFQARFNRFKNMEETLRIIKYPDIKEINTLQLDVFEWLEIEDLEMELIEFQNSIWAR